MKRVFLTGGTGYIGSHTAVSLIEAGLDVVVFDNLSNSKREVLNRVRRITGKELTFIQGDIRNQVEIESALDSYPCDAVIHFAGLKSVGESVVNPLGYYENNVAGTISLLQAMRNHGVKNLVFSSSATVYGSPEYLPVNEAHPVGASQPYGQSKLVVENMLRDLSASDASWHITILRYFNPVGAHESGLIGEDPVDVPNNLMPYVAQVAVGRLPYLNVWGGDYPTPDGTGVRDYIHVVDLAEGHLQALLKLEERSLFTVNLGTGRGYSVLEIIKAFEAASGRPVPYKICGRRAGDMATVFACTRLAEQQLEWKAVKDIDAMCADHWRWQSLNPLGYSS
jgi:UDP-glucose 4-epimerase